MVAHTKIISRLALAAFVVASGGLAAGQGKGKKKDDPQVDGLKTFSQTGWGGGPDGHDRARKLLNNHFEDLFPNGLRVGRKRKNQQFYVVKTVDEIKAVLPIHGIPAPMTERTKGGLKAAGGLAGQLIAAKLNATFDRNGLLGNRSELGEPPFVDLIFRGHNVPRAVRGLTAGEVIGVVDDVLAGAHGTDFKASKKAIDVDGDDDPDASLMDLREALYILNTNYRAGADAGRRLVEDKTSGSKVADAGGEKKSGEEKSGEKKPGAKTSDGEGEATPGDGKGRADRRRQRDDEPTDDKRESDLDRAEEDRDGRILEVDDERRRDRLRAREEAKREAESKREEGREKEIEDREKDIDRRHKAKRRQIQTRYEENKARIEKEYEERHGRAHPGKGHGVEGSVPGKKVPPGKAEKGGKGKGPKSPKKGGVKIKPTKPKKAGGGN